MDSASTLAQAEVTKRRMGAVVRTVVIWSVRRCESNCSSTSRRSWPSLLLALLAAEQSKGRHRAANGATPLARIAHLTGWVPASGALLLGD